MITKATTIILLFACLSAIGPSDCLAFQSRERSDPDLAGDFLRLLRTKKMLEDMMLVEHQKDAIKQAQEALHVQAD